MTSSSLVYSEKTFLGKRHLSEIKMVNKSWPGKKATVGMFRAKEGLGEARSLSEKLEELYRK